MGGHTGGTGWEPPASPCFAPMQDLLPQVTAPSGRAGALLPSPGHNSGGVSWKDFPPPCTPHHLLCLMQASWVS